MVLVFAVLSLIVVGAGVTSKDAGMAYPTGFFADGALWNPPGWWQADDTRWEHGHRLIGRFAGILAILLAMACWPAGGVIRRLGICNLLAITAQGLLGIFRVNEISTGLAMMHGITGQMCLGLACCLPLVTGRTWLSVGEPRKIQAAVLLQRLCLVTTLAIFVQLVLGAGQRHFSMSVVLVAHVFWAVVVSLLVGWVAMWVMGQSSGRHFFRRIGLSLFFLLFLQLMLGGGAFVVTVLQGKAASSWLQWAVPSAHVAVGSVMMGLMVVLTVSTYRMFRPMTDVSRAAELSMAAAP